MRLALKPEWVVLGCGMTFSHALILGWRDKMARPLYPPIYHDGFAVWLYRGPAGFLGTIPWLATFPFCRRSERYRGVALLRYSGP